MRLIENGFISVRMLNLRMTLKRPLSLTAGILASLLVAYETIQIAGGNLYERVLEQIADQWMA